MAAVPLNDLLYEEETQSRPVVRVDESGELLKEQRDLLGWEGGAAVGNTKPPGFPFGLRGEENPISAVL